MYTVLVLMSTYNGEKYIDEQMQSLLAQEEVNLHILVRDDGSKDNTLERLSHWESQYPNHITTMLASNIGVVRSFFELTEQCPDQYDYYAFCDQDDVWLSTKLISAIHKLNAHSKLSTELSNEQADTRPLMYCSTTQMTDEALNPTKLWPPMPEKRLSPYNALIENVCVGCTMLMNREAMLLIKQQMPKQVDKVIMHDWWVYLSVSCFGEVVFDEKSYILYRQHQHNALGGATDRLFSKWVKRIKRFIKGKNRYILSIQADEFMATFGERVKPTYQQDINNFLRAYRKGPVRRLQYILQTPFYRQCASDHFIFKLVYIMGKL